MTTPPGRIDGTRLVLRLPTIEDAGAIFQRVARDPEVTKYLLWTPHPEVAATRRVIAEKLNTERRRPDLGDHVAQQRRRHRDGQLPSPGAALRRNRLLHRPAMVGQGLHARGARHAVDDAAGRSGRLSRLGHHACRQRAVHAGAAARGVRDGRPLGPARRVPHDGPEPQDSLLYATALR